MDSTITIYNPDSEPFRDPVVVTKEAVHEEELMKTDLVRLSWVDTDRYDLKTGCYIIPFPDRKDIGNISPQFVLLRDYQPERMATGGYRYQPEFCHPVMRLAYVPLIFTTLDATSTVVEKTEWPYIGSLTTLLAYLANSVSNAFGLPSEEDPIIRRTAGTAWGRDPRYNPTTSQPSQELTGGEESESYFVFPLDIDITQTVSITFKDNSLWSAFDALAKVCGCEWHIDWYSSLIYFGDVRLGGTEECLLSVDYYDEHGAYHPGNVCQPSVAGAGEVQYNAFLIHGSSRNNTRRTENGNIPVSAPLTLAWEYDGNGQPIPIDYDYSQTPPKPIYGPTTEDGTEKYPHSIIDVRPFDEDHRRRGPQLLKVMNIDGVYPHYELYLYDLVERRMYKYNDNKELTTEQWSVWYTRLAKKNGDGTFTDYRPVSRPFATVTDKSTPTGASGPYDLTVSLPYGSYFDKAPYSHGGVNYYVVTARNGSYESLCEVSESDGYCRLAAPTVGTSTFMGLWANTDIGDTLYFTDHIDASLVPGNNKDTSLVDGLSPMLAMQINDDNDEDNPNLLGTREFELTFHDGKVAFDDAADVERPQAVSAILTVRNLEQYIVIFDTEYRNEYFTSAGMVNLKFEGEVYEQVEMVSWMPQDDDTDYIAFDLCDQSVDHRDWASRIGPGTVMEFTYGFNLNTLPARNVKYEPRILPEGYFEIIHTEEGSDKLCVPTTSEQGIYPKGTHDIDEAGIAHNNKATIFNIAMGGDAKVDAQVQLETEALVQIAAERVDTGNYVVKSNVVAFEEDNPNLYIGQRVHLFADGLNIFTRVLKLSTRLDYAFDQEVTVGNAILKGQTARLRDEIASLKNDFESWVAGGTGAEAGQTGDNANILVYRGHWRSGEKYYYESLNRATRRMETSEVENYGGGVWHCKRNLTAQEPVPGCTDWEMVSAPVVQYTDRGIWSSSDTYYYNDLHYEEDYATGEILVDRIEVSQVWHLGCLWECRQTGTQEEPGINATQWELIQSAGIALGFYDQNDAPLTLISLRSQQEVNITIIPHLLIGGNDVSSDVVTWKWERTSIYTDLDVVWNNQQRTTQRTLTLVNSDLPTGWEGTTLSFKCTATWGTGDEVYEIFNQVNF